MLTLKSLCEQERLRADRAERQVADLLEQLQSAQKATHIYVHHEAAPSVRRSLDLIFTRLEHIDMALTDMEVALGKIDTATSNIAADIVNLKKLIVPGMSQEDVDKVQKRLDATAQRLEGIAADTEDPVPDTPAEG